jgi:hypothetical protein
LARASNVNQTQIQHWLRWYKNAQPTYKPHALMAIYLADGVQMLAAVLKALNLEKSVDLVRDWNDAGAEKGTREPVREADAEKRD